MVTQYVPPVTWVDSPEDFMKFVRHVKDTGESALDTETTGLNRAKDYVLFWSACPDEQTRYCFSREIIPKPGHQVVLYQSDIRLLYVGQFGSTCSAGRLLLHFSHGLAMRRKQTR